MTSDQFILQCIEGYKISFHSTPSQNKQPSESVLSSEEEEKTKISIGQLVEKKAIFVCDHSNEEFLSPYFLREKPDGSDRFILNLKNLNKFIEPPHSKIEDVKTSLKMITRKCFMASIDLKDAYLLIPVENKYRKFLRFCFQQNLYEFTCMSFGLCTAPYTFTKILKPVVQKLRKEGIVLVIYLDDILIFAESENECTRRVMATQALLESLGFIINTKKKSTESFTAMYLSRFRFRQC